MTDADDDIRQAVAALRVKNQPAAEDLAAAPILDGWYFYHPFGDARKGVGAKGVVSGDARFADGSAIFTSKLRAVDGLGDRLGDGSGDRVSDVFQQWMGGTPAQIASEAGVLFENSGNPGNPQVQAILNSLPASGG